MILVLLACFTPAEAGDDGRDLEREALVEQLERTGIKDERVLAAMKAVPRHRFVPDDLQSHAYKDRPLPIGLNQTISQPWVVARMTELAEPKATDKALEVGTGSAYQAAVLAQVVDHVYTVEILCEHAETAKARFAELALGNITAQCADGYAGWAEHAPFDLIVVTAAPETIPPPLLEQLAEGGRLIIPVGPAGEVQTLMRVRKKPGGELAYEEEVPVRFVPMTGEAQTR